MGELYLANAFSLGMLSDFPARLTVYEVDDRLAGDLLRRGFISCVGHESTAKIIEKRTGVKVPVQRISIKLERGDRVLVFQLLKRLPEGKVLSEEELLEIPCKWLLVEVK